jgi:hypothetical protein
MLSFSLEMMSSFLFIFLSIFLLSRAFGERAFCFHLDVVSVGGSLTLIVAWCLSWTGISQVICSWRHCLSWWLLSYCYRRAISLRSVPWLNRWTLSLSLSLSLFHAVELPLSLHNDKLFFSLPVSTTYFLGWKSCTFFLDLHPPVCSF